jgi:hypothetical protein
VEERTLCIRCGAVWENLKRKRQEVLCLSCRARPAKTIKYGSERCVPWVGDFDRFDNPMQHGVYLLPGVRLCGHSDCVNPLHVSEVVEQLDD